MTDFINEKNVDAPMLCHFCLSEVLNTDPEKIKNVIEESFLAERRDGLVITRFDTYLLSWYAARVILAKMTELHGNLANLAERIDSFYFGE